jgi:hypothetical protein
MSDRSTIESDTCTCPNLSAFMCNITKTSLEIMMFNAYQTPHFFFDGFRYSCLSDIVRDMYMTKPEDSTEVFIFTEAGKRSVRLMQIASWG